MIFLSILNNYFKENRLLIIVYILLIIILFPIQTILLPVLYSNLFENIKEKKYKNVNYSNIITNIKNLNGIGLIYLIIFFWFIVILFFFLKEKISNYIVPKFLSYLRNIFFKNTILKHNNNYEDINIGDYISRLLEVTRQVRDSFKSLFNDIIPMILGLIIINIIMFKFNKNIAYILLLNFIFIILLNLIYAKKIFINSYNREGIYYKLSDKISDTLNNLMNIYINNKSETELKKNIEYEKYYSDITIKEQEFISNYVLISSIIIIIIFSTILIYSYHLNINNKINSKTLITILLISIYYLGFNMKLFTDLPQFYRQVGSAIQSNNILKNEISENNNINNNLNNINFNSTFNIEFKNVTFKYPKTNKYILKNSNFKIKSNLKTAIIGQSGSGKTTIMKILLKMYNIDSGEILINNYNINNININYLRSNISYINQRTGLFNDSILNNIKYGNDLTDNEIYKILNDYDLMKVYNNLSKGVNSNAGVNGNLLSLGMQKVTLLIRGLYKKSNIYILDEPLAGLDKDSRQKIIKMINDKFKNKCLIIITHDTEIIPLVDEVININNILN